jgi:CRP-like cAMP-binding protein
LVDAALPMFERTYNEGDRIYLAGDASDAFFRIRSGTVRISVGPNGAPENSGILGPGDLFGALQLPSGGPRQENASASGKVIVDALTRAEFLRLLETDAAAVHVALSALFDHVAIAARTSAAVREPEAGPAVTTARVAVRVYGANQHVQDQIGPEGIAVTELPFRVGHRSPNGSPLEESVHLQLNDPRPYYMSRRHFAIELDGDGVRVRDCGSPSGTLVNGVPVGARAQSDAAPLAGGRNEAIAGRSESPFKFTVIVE